MNDEIMDLNKPYRQLWIDYLRIIATYAVICVHTTCQIIDSSEFEMPTLGSLDWSVACTYNAFSRYCVPIFLMISGALFIGKKIRISDLYFKYILRIIIAYLTWSFFYAVVRAGDGAHLKSIIITTLYGESRFTFLCYLTGLYIITPILNKIVESKIIAVYYLLLCFVFCFCEPQIANVLSSYSIPVITTFMNIIDITVDKMNIQFVMGMSGYYVLGYVLSHCQIKKKKFIYVLGIAGGLITAGFTIIKSINAEIASFEWFNYLSVNVLCEAVALFLFARYEMSKIKVSEKISKIIVKISKYTFGIYLTHTFVLDILFPKVLGISANSCCAIFSIPIITTSVFIVSLIISFGVNHIPILSRYIV